MNDMMNIKKIVFIVFQLCLIFSCNSEKSELNFKIIEKKSQKIDSLIKKNYEEDLFHGGIVVSKYGEIMYENYLGLANRTWNIPVEPNVKFDIASLNKSMIIFKKVCGESGLYCSLEIIALITSIFPVS